MDGHVVSGWIILSDGKLCPGLRTKPPGCQTPTLDGWRCRTMVHAEHLVRFTMSIYGSPT